MLKGIPETDVDYYLVLLIWSLFEELIQFLNPCKIFASTKSFGKDFCGSTTPCNALVLLLTEVMHSF